MQNNLLSFLNEEILYFKELNKYLNIQLLRKDNTPYFDSDCVLFR